MIQNHVKHFPSDFVYEPPKVYEEFYGMLLVCVEIGFLDISDTADIISKQVFFALASFIRDLKFGEEKWNPEIGKKGDEKYDPLLPDLTQFKEAISEVLQNVEKKTNEGINGRLSNVEKLPTLSDVIPHLQNAIRQAKDFIVRTILEGLEEVVSNLDHIVKLYNAYIVGFINGLIDFIASIVEAIGFLFSLFNYESTKQLIEGIKQFISEVSWSKVGQLLKKELQQLFAFMIGDEAYKNAYEFGLFIPKLLDLAIDIIFGVKGAVNTARKLTTVIKNIPENAKKISKIFDDFVQDVKLLGINRKTLDELADKGITIDVNYKINFTANAGIPTKIIDGKSIKIYHKNTLLKAYDNEIKANQYLEQLKDVDFLKKEIAAARKKISEGLKKLAKNLTKENKSFLRKNGLKISKTSGGQSTKLELVHTNSKNVIIRALPGDIEKYLKFLKLDVLERQKLIDKVIRDSKKSPSKYNIGESSKKLKEIGIDIEIPASSGKRAAGVTPDFIPLGESMFMKNGKLGNGRYSKIKGVSESQINDVINKIQKFKGEVKVNITSDRTPDFNNCWRAMGIDPTIGNKVYEKLNITWHHLDDLDSDLKSTMQLVHSRIHEQTTVHLGSNGQMKILLSLID